jgi:hypothetical protein
MKLVTDQTEERDHSFNSEKVFFKPRTAVLSIISGGLTVGVLDGLFALIYYGLMLGVKTMRIFQSVASGLLGKDSFDGGTQTFLLGIFLHFTVAACIAAVYLLKHDLKLSNFFIIHTVFSFSLNIKYFLAMR